MTPEHAEILMDYRALISAALACMGKRKRSGGMTSAQLQAREWMLAIYRRGRLDKMKEMTTTDNTYHLKDNEGEYSPENNA